MPLIPPSLDDRSFDDLVQEMLASLPAHTPEYSSPQPGDPGRTLIELFGWLADTILYRANLVPEKQRLAFLKLLGLPMLPAASASGLVSLAFDPSRTTPLTLASGATLNGPLAFETLGEVDVLPVAAQVYIKSPLTPSQAVDSMSLLTGLRTLYKLAATPSGYMTAPVFVASRAARAGIDLQTGTLDRCIWIALVAAKPELRDDVRLAIGKSAGQRILNVGFMPSLQPPDPLAEIGPGSAVLASWQMSLATPAGQPPSYAELKVDEDTTAGLTQPGVIRLFVPPGAELGAPANDVRSDAMAGVGPKPPRVDDPGFDDRLVTWVRLAVRSHLGVSWIGINAAEIDQRTTYRGVVIGVSDGSADQQFDLPQPQVDPGSFQLEVDMPGLGFQLWEATDDLAAVQGPRPHFRLDPEAGTVFFGNQLQGLIPPSGRRIRVRQMRAGGGAAGNLPPGTLTKISGKDTDNNPVTQLVVQQPVATSGGAEAETLAQAEQRIPARLRHRDRAVTASDYKSIVLEIPGAAVARVEVLPLFKPQTRSAGVPGVVSVMVIPGKEGVLPPCPRADRPLLETVYHCLDPRRPATAEMYVIGVEYVGLGLSISVEVRAGFQLLEAGKQVEAALRSYLWPIPPGGPENTGWPLGRRVRSLELEVIASQVPGIAQINGLNLFTRVGTDYQRIPPDANNKSELALESWQLPELLQVVVIAQPEGLGVAPPDTLAPPAPTDDSVAVPVVPKVC